MAETAALALAAQIIAALGIDRPFVLPYGQSATGLLPKWE